MMFSGSKAGLLIQVGVALGVVAVILASIFILSNDIKNRADSVAASRADLNIKIAQLNNIAQLQSDKERAAPYLENLRNAYPKRDDLLSFPDRLDRIASSNNVGIQFVFGNETEDNIQFSMVVQGGYDNITSFIRTIEEEIIFIDLNSFDLTQRDGGYEGGFTGTVFFDG